MNTLTKKSYSKSIEDIKNRTDLIKNIISDINEKFNYNEFEMCKKLKVIL